MKEYIVLIIGVVLLVLGIYTNSEYDVFKDKWREYFFSGIGLYVILLISIALLIRKKERRGSDFLPDTKYTNRFEKV